MPYPVKFDAEDLREMTAPNEKLSKVDRGFEFLQGMGGLGQEGWVLTEDYEDAVAFLKESKEEALAEERKEIMAHWPWDDMDEEMWM